MTDAPAPATPPETPPAATVTGGTGSAADAPRRGIALGVWSLVLVLVPVVYVGLGLLFVLFGQGSNGIAVLGEIAFVMFFLGFIVIPTCLMIALVLAIIAIVVNRAPGKVLGIVSLVVIAVSVVALVLVLTGSDSPLFWTDF